MKEKRTILIGRTILIVDDNSANLHLLNDSLSQAGFKVAIAESGEKALQRVEYMIPDLILLDLIMPQGMDGFETCRRLKEHEALRDIPVIFLTARKETTDKVKGFEVGGVDFITRPFQLEEVIARVETHLKICQLQQKLQEENARFRALSEATFEGVVVHDKGQVIDVNQRIEEMFGYARNEVVDRHIQDFLTQESYNIIAEHLHGNDEHPYEAKGKRKDGTLFPIEIQGKAFPYDGREVRIAAIRDLSPLETLEEIAINDRFENIIGKSTAMKKVYQKIVKVAASDAMVLIQGDTGTGKELVARTIHELSQRKRKNFVAVNCGGLPETLFESDLFGHRKGAFTGAITNKSGRFKQAEGGTLFLDEIGELSLKLQVKLLRVLQEKKYRPLGAEKNEDADVRLIAATNQNLEKMLEQKDMREDFFYRINVIPIHVVPLLDRQEDIPILIDHFLKQYGEGNSQTHLPRRTINAMCAYDWPGNIRELQNVLKRYLTTGDLDFPGIGQSDSSESDEGFVLKHIGEGKTFEEAIDELEKVIMIKKLAQSKGIQKETAKMLNMPVRSFREKAKRYKINSKE